MKRLFIIYILTILFLSGCEQNSNSEFKIKDGKMKIVTTTGMIMDAIRNITKDSAEVEALMGPGVDPHLYKATQGDLVKLRKADVIFYNGLYLEGKMEDIFPRLGRIKPVIAVGEAIDKSRLKASPTYKNAPDPHIWFDISLWTQAVSYMKEKLVELDPENAQYYRRNADEYLEKLDSLHLAVREMISTIPEDQRVLVTAHDAFGYFGDAYDIEVRGLQGISTMSEFGLKDITDLVKFIVNRQIKAVFVETSVSERAIRAVVEGCRESGWDVRIGGSLFSDAMGEEGTFKGTYIGMVDHNVRTITEALK